MYSFEYIKKFIFEENKKYKENKLMKDRIKNKNKHKGIQKSVDIYHNDYKKCFYNEEIIYEELYNLQLKKQNIYLDKINKIALNPFESKRYRIDNINSLPFLYVE